MLYIVTEDSGSGFQFWSSVAKVIIPDPMQVIVRTSNGVQNLKYEIGATSLKEGDRLLVAFDVAVDNPEIDLDAIISTAKALCIERKAMYIQTTYYCFEEVFLSYKFIANEKMPSDMQELSRHVQSCIYSGCNYYNKLNPLVSRFIGNLKLSEEPTKETFAKRLLTNITRRWHGNFTIDQGNLGECWLTSCIDLEEKFAKKYGTNYCSICQYRCKDRKAYDKIIELETYSIFGIAESMKLSALAKEASFITD